MIITRGNLNFDQTYHCIKIHRKNALYKNIRQLETKTPLFYIKRYRTYVQAYLQLQVFQFMKVNNSATDNVEIVSFKV